MNLSPLEILIILVVVALIIALAFRTGHTRGGQKRAAPSERKQPQDADKRD